MGMRGVSRAHALIELWAYCFRCCGHCFGELATVEGCNAELDGTAEMFTTALPAACVKLENMEPGSSGLFVFLREARPPHRHSAELDRTTIYALNFELAQLGLTYIDLCSGFRVFVAKSG